WEANPETTQFSFVSSKAQALLGYPLERWLEEPDFWKQLIHPDDRGRILTAYAAAVDERRNHTLEYRVIAADGRGVWIRDVVHIKTDEMGRAIRLHGVMVDITD